MIYTGADFERDMAEQEAIDKQAKKKKLAALLDKYGESREAIDMKADIRDTMEYMWNDGDKLIDEVLEERRLARAYRLRNREESDALRLQQAISQKNNDEEEISQQSSAQTEDKSNPSHKKENDENLSEQNPYQKKKAADEDKFKISHEENNADEDVIEEDEDEKSEKVDSLDLAKKNGQYKESAKFDNLVQSIFQEEGGYEDNLKKIDQPTNMGIIQSTLDNFNRAHPNLKIDKKLKGITKDDALLIYKLDYYDHYRLGEIDNPIIVKTLFHMFVNSSPTRVALIIQRSINDMGEKVDIDGTIGSITIDAINKLNRAGKSKELNKKLIELRLKYENTLKDYRKYPGRRNRFKKMLEE